MGVEEACDYLLFLYERESDKLLYERWIAGPQYSKSFEDFKHELKPITIRDDEDIINEVMDFLELREGRKSK